MRLLYATLLWLAYPFIRLHHTMGRNKQELHSRCNPLSPGGILLYAASLGEVNTAALIIPELRIRYPNTTIIVSTTTITGANQVKSQFSHDSQVVHCYLPYDLPHQVKQFLAQVRPAMLLIVESGLWFNLIAQCYRNHIPILVLNARLSLRSTKRYRFIKPLIKPAIAQLTHVMAQGPSECARFRWLGIPSRRLSMGGNLKCELTISDTINQEIEKRRQQWALDRFIWIAASTSAPEEAYALSAHRALLDSNPNALLILVPRHPERFAAVRALANASQLSWEAYSQNPQVTQQTAVLVGDTMGQLLIFYGMAQLAFIGGSFGHRGGQSPIEPAAFSIPLLMGPNYTNCEAIVNHLREAGGLSIVKTAAQLTALILELACDPALRKRMGQAAYAVLEKHRGALAQQLRCIENYLPETIRLKGLKR